MHKKAREIYTTIINEYHYKCRKLEQITLFYSYKNYINNNKTKRKTKDVFFTLHLH